MACCRGGDDPHSSGKAKPESASSGGVMETANPNALQDRRFWEHVQPSTPTYWETDAGDSSGGAQPGPRPSDLYGKFTWKIENFSQITKRELRSNTFEVGRYKWYILVYPQGCDICNHLSLFLCVADYDKLLPGWSHFAQFTIAVVNKDPKKSKYSDTLHRFCKKEHDWGWKKFMELSKIQDGFTVADTLVIKAQVQVIRENAHRPFHCLDCQYWRELIRVYSTNVETICRRFVEEKREKLFKLMEDNVRWASFRAFWSEVKEKSRCSLAREKTDVILKAVVKRFFNEKEVTSTLVMDALYSGLKALDYCNRNKKGKNNGVEFEETSNPVVFVDKDTFVLADDVLVLLERAATESLPPYKDEKGPQIRSKDSGSGDDFGKESIERDEKRLTELGRRTIEMFVLTYLFSNRIEVAYHEAIALKRQEELIREEEAAGQAVTELKLKREAAEKEKRAKKKQVKRRNKTKEDKETDDKGKRVNSQTVSETYDKYVRGMEADDTSSAVLDTDLLNAAEATSSSSSHNSTLLDADTVILSLRERVQWLEQRLLEKEEEVIILQEQLSLYQHEMVNENVAPNEPGCVEEVPSSPSNASSEKDECSSSTSLKEGSPSDSGIAGYVSGLPVPSICNDSGNEGPLKGYSPMPLLSRDSSTCSATTRLAPVTSAEASASGDSSSSQSRTWSNFSALDSNIFSSSRPVLSGSSNHGQHFEALEKDFHSLPESVAVSKGFTFGTITPEIIYSQNYQSPEAAESNGHYNQPNSTFLNNVEFHRVDAPLYQERSLEELFENHQDANDVTYRQHLASNNEYSHYLMKQSMIPHMENTYVGSVLSEEFPHLDIITDLLDDDKKKGKALSTYLLQSGAQSINPQYVFEELQRSNAERFYMEAMQSTYDGGSERSEMMLPLDETHQDHLPLHVSESYGGNGGLLRDSIQTVSPFSHSALLHSFSHQNGSMDGIPRQHWTSGNVAMYSANSLNRGRRGVDAQLMYPLQNHHIPQLSQHPQYNHGDNGYALYSPLMKQP